MPRYTPTNPRRDVARFSESPYVELNNKLIDPATTVGPLLFRAGYLTRIQCELFFNLGAPYVTRTVANLKTRHLLERNARVAMELRLNPIS